MKLGNSTRVALVDLLKKGQLGPLKLGLSADVVIDLCGPNYSVVPSFSREEDRILYYGRSPSGPLQIYLEDERVWGIEIDALALPTQFSIPNLPRFELRRGFLGVDYLKRFMASNGISWTTTDERFGQVDLKTECGTRIWFDDGLLMEIQVFRDEMTNYRMQPLV